MVDVTTVELRGWVEEVFEEAGCEFLLEQQTLVDLSYLLRPLNLPYYFRFVVNRGAYLSEEQGERDEWIFSSYMVGYEHLPHPPTKEGVVAATKKVLQGIFSAASAPLPTELEGWLNAFLKVTPFVVVKPRAGLEVLVGRVEVEVEVRDGVVMVWVRGGRDMVAPVLELVEKFLVLALAQEVSQ